MGNKTAFSGTPIKWVFLLAGILCLAISTGVSAQQNENPCADDTAKLCKNVPAAGGQVMQCLNEHANDVSPACKEALDERKKFQEFVQACREDVGKLCAYTKRETDKIIQCLRRHEDELSPMCKQKMPPM
jgi:hypothetical protein